MEKVEELLAYLDGDAPKPHAPLGLTYDAWREAERFSYDPDEVDGLTQDLTEAQDALTGAENDRDRLQDECNDLEDKVGDIKKDLQEVQQNLAAALAANEALARDLEEARLRAFTLAHSQDQSAIAKARMRTPIMTAKLGDL